MGINTACRSEAQYQPSVVENFNKDPENKDTYVDPTQRKSETAWLADGDAVVDCVKSRAAEFQGFAPNKSMEELAVLKYKPGGSFTPHYDCMPKPRTFETGNKVRANTNLRRALIASPSDRQTHILFRYD